MSEDQLFDRDEAILGDRAEHMKEIEERGDTSIDPDQIAEVDDEVICCMQACLLSSAGHQNHSSCLGFGWSWTVLKD